MSLLILSSLFLGYLFYPIKVIGTFSKIQEISEGGYISIQFNTPMDKEYFKENLVLSPESKYSIDWINMKTVHITPQGDFHENDSISLSFNNKLKDIFGKEMNNDIKYEYIYVSKPKVVLSLPKDESDVGNKIVVMFNRPMTSLTTLDDEKKKNIPITITPSINGKYKWLGTRTIEFIPNNRFDYSTKYTVIIDSSIKDITGGNLDKNYEFSFYTPKIKLEKSYVIMDGNQIDLEGYNYMFGKNPIYLSFNQEINIKNIGDKINISEQIISEKQENSSENNKSNLINYSVIYDKSNKNTVIITPNSDWIINKNYKIAISNKIPAKEGDLIYEEESIKEIIFSGVPELKVISSLPSKDSSENDEEKYSYSTGVQIDFSVPMDPNNFIKYISIFPETKVLENKEDVYLSNNNTQFYDWWSLNPSTEYTVTLKKGMPDIFGRKLEEDYSWKFVTKPFYPELYLETKGRDFGVFETGIPPIFRIHNMNIKSINFTLEKLSFKDILDIRKEQVSNWEYDINTHKYEVLKEWKTESKGITNKINTDIIEVGKYFKKEDKKFQSGMYLFKISSPEVKRYDGSEEVSYTLFSITEYALTLKYSNNEALVFASSLKEGTPVKNMIIKFIDMNGKEIDKGVTDENGLLRMSLNVKDLIGESNSYEVEFYVIGEKDGKETFLGANWNDGIDPWQFSLTENFRDPTINKNQIFGEIYTDRPLYKPGEKVYYKGIVREFDKSKFKIPKGASVSFNIFDNDMNEIFNKKFQISEFGSFNGEFSIPEDVKYGFFTLNADIIINDTIDTWNNLSKRIEVTHFQKSPFKVEVLPTKDEYFFGDTVKGIISSQTFYGAPIEGQKVQFTVDSTDYYFNRFDEDWYSFAPLNEWCYFECSGNNHHILSEEKVLDSKGESPFSFKIESKNNENDTVNLSQVYTIKASVYDNKSDREVSGRSEFIAHFSDIYVGVKTDNYMINAGENMQFKGISVDYKGNKKGNQNIKAELLERNYKTVKRKNVDGEYYYENEVEDKSIEVKNLKSDDNGVLNDFFQVNKGGSYIIRLSTSDTKNRKVVAETDFWASTLEQISWPRANHDRIDIIKDKREYKVGDTAKLMVKSPFKDVYALVTTEQAGIIESNIIKIASNAEIIEVPIKKEYIPNVYVSVIIYKGREQFNEYDEKTKRDIGQPEFKIGYIKLPVNIDPVTLNIAVKSDKERYVPNEKVTLNFIVNDNKGQGSESELMISVVDMSLLALTGYELPNVLKPFYSERGLGVRTALTQAKLIERFKPGAKGGGGGEKKARGDFKNTAFFVADLKTNKEGQAQTSFTLPDNLTEWKVTVIAQDKENRFGSKDMEFMETKRVIIDPSLPQFFTDGDTVDIKTVIINRENETQNFSIDLKFLSEKELTSKIIGSSSYSMKIDHDARETVIYKIKAGNDPSLKMQFSVKGDNSEDVFIDERKIQKLTTKEIVSLSGSTDGEVKESVYIPSNIDLNNGQLNVQASATLAYLLPENLNILKSYPYDCAEQTISKLFPNTLIKNNKLLSKILSESESTEISNSIYNGLTSLYAKQNLDGSWGYFDNESKYRDYLTAYIVIALEEMKKSGESIDEKVLFKARDYLSKDRNNEDLITQGFIRMALSYSDKTDISEYVKRIIKEDNEKSDDKKMPYFALVYWAIAANDPTILNLIIESANHTDRGVYFEEKEGNYSQYWSTTKRLTALTAYALILLDENNPLIPKIIYWMNNNRNASGFGNTQESVWSLLTLIRYVERENLDNINFVLDVERANTGVMHTSFDSSNPFKVTKSTLPLNTLDKDFEHYFDFTKQGNGKAEYSIVYEYYVPAEKIEPLDEGFSIIREWYTLDGKKITSMPKTGETFKIKLTIVSTSEGNFVAVEDYVPSGVMPINTEFATERSDLDENLVQNKEEWWKWGVLDYFGHVEFRDNMVFMFAEWLPAGVYEYEYAARVTHEGEFIYLPARVFEMYNEDRFGRSEGQIINNNQ